MTNKTAIAERRRLPRVPADGSLNVSFDDPLPVTVRADLVDVSDEGLRVAHDSARLVPGLIVSMERDGQTRRARVIWTHLKEGRRVSGFLLL